jgi:hypothetical protein
MLIGVDEPDTGAGECLYERAQRAQARLSRAALNVFDGHLRDARRTCEVRLSPAQKGARGSDLSCRVAGGETLGFG